MWLKIKKRLLTRSQKNYRDFVSLFLLEFSLIIAILSVLDLQITFLSLKNLNLFSISIAFAFVSYALWYTSNHQKYLKLKSFLELISPPFFITAIGVLIVNYFSTYQNSLEINPHFFVWLTIFSGFSIFCNCKATTLSPNARNKYRGELKFYTFLILIILSLTVIRLLLIQVSLLNIDESYTFTVNKGLAEYHELSTTQTGVHYGRTPIYNFFTGLTYILSDNALISLRLFNIIFFLLVTPLIYFAIKDLLNKSVAILAIVLININWYITSILLTGRSYTFTIIFSFFAFYLLLSTFKRNTSATSIGWRILGSVVLIAANFFEGHAVATYHLLILLIVTAISVFLKQKINNKLKLAILVGISLGVSVIGCYAFIYHPSTGYFLINKAISWRPSFDFIYDFGNILITPGSVGIGIFSLMIAFVIFYKNEYREKKILILASGYVLAVYVIQSLFASSQTKFFYYYSDLVIPTIIIFSYFIVEIIQRNTYFSKGICGGLILILYITCSAYYTIETFHSKVSYALTNPPFSRELLNSIPTDAVILTNQPQLIQILDPERKIYSIFRWINDDEVVDINLRQDIKSNEKYATRVYTETELGRFQDFIYKNIREEYVITNNQLYSAYSGLPLVMDVEHLRQINSYHNGNVYLIYTEASFDRRARDRNSSLYDFIFNNLYTEYEYTYKDIVSTQKRDLPILTIGKLSI